MLNAYWEPLEFEVPSADGTKPPGWRRCIDTAAPPPEDVRAWADAPCHETPHCVVQPRSLILLAARLKRAAAGPQFVVS
jgi:glycogen operon protein